MFVVSVMSILFILSIVTVLAKARTHWAHFPSADCNHSRGFKILNMFDRGSRPTITE